MSLRGKRVLVTRAAHQAGPLTALLSERGAIPLPYPCLAVAPPTCFAELDRALCSAAAGRFEWILFGSSNSARQLAARLRQLRLSLPGTRVAILGAAGEQTARNLPGARLCASVPAGDPAAVPAALQLRPGARLLLAQSDVAPATLKNALQDAGAQVTNVVAWRNVPGRGGVALAAMLREQQVDGLLLTSASIVRNLLSRLRAENGDSEPLRALPCACIGRSTASAAQEAGFQRIHVAWAHTLVALLDALAAYWHTATYREQGRGLP